MLTQETMDLRAAASDPKASAQIVLGSYLAGLRAQEEEKKAKMEAETKKYVCELDPCEGFRARRVESFSPDPLEGEFDIVECLVRYVQENVLKMVICGWLLGMTAGAWPSVWSIGIPFSLSALVAYWYHRKAKASEPKPVMIL